MIVLILLLLGLCVGSFINALVWRMHEGKNVARGRSMCTSCGHQLSALELVPIASWFFLGGRCRWCSQPISKQYPLVEATAAVVFAGSYLFWPASFDGGQQVLFAAWLSSFGGLLALAIYDLKWMILPNHLVYPSFFIAAAGRLAYISFFASDKSHQLELWVLSVLVSSGIFYLLHELSKGQWIGFGDVRLGLVTGTLLATPQKSLLMIFIASLLGTFGSIGVFANSRHVLNHRIAYGPYLIAACVIVVVFGSNMLDWYQRFL